VFTPGRGMQRNRGGNAVAPLSGRFLLKFISSPRLVEAVRIGILRLQAGSTPVTGRKAGEALSGLLLE
jgi:hypothetical protein